MVALCYKVASSAWARLQTNAEPEAEKRHDADASVARLHGSWWSESHGCNDGPKGLW
jgi:hypothetical protein